MSGDGKNLREARIVPIGGAIKSLLPAAKAPEPDPNLPAREGTWTHEQWDAIVDRGNDLALSAAAGSGKTAVLTERVLRLITGAGGQDPIPLDELLVITFTRKAAQEMRERIESKIFDGLTKNPDDAALRAAADALPRAWIMTLDAFCDRLVRRHFHQAGVAPNARIANESEDREIAAQAAHELFERLIDGGDRGGGGTGSPIGEITPEDFATLIEATPNGGPGALDELAGRIRALSAFIASLEDPDAWALDARADLKATLTATSLDDLPARRRKLIAQSFSRSLAHLIDGLRALRVHAANEGVGPDALALWDKASADMHVYSDRAWTAADPEGGSLDRILRRGLQWFEENDGAQEIRNLKRHAKNVGPFAPNLKKFSEAVEKWAGAWGGVPPEHWIEAERLSAKQALVTLDLTLAIQSRAQEIKMRRAALGFNDIERLALRLLTSAEHTDSDIARECQTRFQHVLVDECQDISPLQDAIIRRVSRTNDPAPHAGRNLFVVGDVKQSIYRFRRAEPELFTRRLNDWGGRKESPGQDARRATPERRRRIDLRSNFRSRPGVIEFVNRVFERFMDREVGGVDYDDSHKLRAAREDAPGSDPLCVEAHWIFRDAAPATDGDAEPAEDAAPDSEDTETLTGVEAEADWIASRILELTAPDSPDRIHDKAGLRPIRPGDCAILARRISGRIDTWVLALARRGLRVVASGQVSVLAEPEIAELISALRVADNPFQDFPLAALMRSPIGAFDENDLLRIRMSRREGAFHEAVWRAAGRGEVFGPDPHGEMCGLKVLPTPGAGQRPAPQRRPDCGAGLWPAPDGAQPADRLKTELSAKLEAFLQRVDRWRRIGARAGAEAALDAIIRDTDLDAWLLGTPNGDNRLRNIDRLRNIMRDHAARAGEGGLGGFITYLDQLGDDAGSEPEADAEDPDAVRLMSVHKSKGLEFPVVFLPGLIEKFSGAGSSGGFNADAEWGLTMPGVDPARRLRFRPPSDIALGHEESRRARAEDMRLLYVAMTRARERLALVGMLRRGGASGEALAAEWARSAANIGEVCPSLVRLQAAAPGDLIAPALARLRMDGPAWLSVDLHPASRARDAGRDLPRVRDALRLGADPGTTLWDAAAEEFREAYGPDPALSCSADASPASGNHRGAAGEDCGAGLRPAPWLILPRAEQTSRAPAKVVASGLRRDPVTGLIHLRGDEAQADPDERELSAEDARARGPLYRKGELAGSRPRLALETSSQAGPLSPAERGTLIHRFIRHLDLTGPLDERGLRRQAETLAARGLLAAGVSAPGVPQTRNIDAAAPGEIRNRELDSTAPGEMRSREFISRLEPAPKLPPASAGGAPPEFGSERASARLLAPASALDPILDAIPFDQIAWFFSEPLGRLAAERPGAVSRELAFRWWIRPGELCAARGGEFIPLGREDDRGRILVQGAIDMVIDEGDRATVIDFKTDTIHPARPIETLVEEYHAQIDTYRRALRSAWRIPVNQAALVFLSARRIVAVE